MSILIAKRLSKKYKKHQIINNINLYVNSGEIVSLLGPNGAGKTTIFYILAGIIFHDTGSITIDKEDISLLPIYKRARKGIGYLPQEVSIFQQLNVYDNLMAIIEFRNDLIYKEKQAYVYKLMEKFNLFHLKKHFGRLLSGGERRRVEIARALAANPKFILLDEPFAGVDPISIIDIKKIIQYLKDNGLGILITDHNVRDTLDICDRTYIVNQGKIIANGTPDNILQNEQVKRVYLGENFFLTNLKSNKNII